MHDSPSCIETDAAPCAASYAAPMGGRRSFAAELTAHATARRFPSELSWNDRLQHCLDMPMETPEQCLGRLRVLRSVLHAFLCAWWRYLRGSCCARLTYLLAACAGEIVHTLVGELTLVGGDKTVGQLACEGGELAYVHLVAATRSLQLQRMALQVARYGRSRSRLAVHVASHERWACRNLCRTVAS